MAILTRKYLRHLIKKEDAIIKGIVRYPLHSVRYSLYMAVDRFDLQRTDHYILPEYNEYLPFDEKLMYIKS